MRNPLRYALDMAGTWLTRSGIISLSDFDAWMDHAVGYGGTLSSAGLVVDQRTALTFNPVLAAANILGQELASLDLNVYEGSRDSRTFIDPVDTGTWKSRTAYKLAYEPNPLMSSYTWRSVSMGHQIWRGNSVSVMAWDGAGRLSSIMPIHPDRVKWFIYPKAPAQIDLSLFPSKPYVGELWYYVRMNDGQWSPVADEDVLHFKGIGGDGITGYDIISLLSESLGIPMAAGRFAARYFANDATPGVILSHPKTLGPQGLKNIRESFEARHKGVDNSHVLAILEEGMQVTTLDVKANEAQLNETRRFGTEDVSRITRIPLHMLGDLSRSTNNNIEHQGLEFGRHCMRPHTKNWEQELNRKLFYGTKIFPEFDLSELYKGDAVSRATANQIQFQNGAIDIDEWRRDCGRNPLPGGVGKIRIVPLNMQQIPVPGAPTLEAPEPKEPTGKPEPPQK